MVEIVARVFKKNNKKLLIIFTVLLLMSTSITVYSMSQPNTLTNKSDENVSRIDTIYDYKATIKPNLLNPEGGTIEVGDTFFKKITTAIPFTIKSTILSDNEVQANGTYEINLIVKAGELWEKTFPLDKEQTFQQNATEISILDKSYNIDIEKMKTFITQAEEETGVRSDQNTIEVIPTIKGTINYDGQEVPFQVNEKLIFQYTYEKIILASEKSYTSSLPFSTTKEITNSMGIFNLELPVDIVRIVSAFLSITLLISTLFIGYKTQWKVRIKPIPTQIEKINKKYSSRIIHVAEKINTNQKSIITVQSFTSILRIADEKELPIFHINNQQSEFATYFIVEGEYFYQYEVSKIENVLSRSSKKAPGSDRYVLD